MNASLLKGDTKLFTDFLKITKTGKYFSFPLINHLERTTKPMYFQTQETVGDVQDTMLPGGAQDQEN